MMASRDLYKDLSKAWRSLEKKMDSRAAKSTLKRLTREEWAEFIDPPIDIEREVDGRWLAAVIGLPGVMSYGSTRIEAVRAVRSLAFRVVAERLEHGGSVPDQVKQWLGFK